MDAVPEAHNHGRETQRDVQDVLDDVNTSEGSDALQAKNVRALIEMQCHHESPAHYRGR